MRGSVVTVTSPERKKQIQPSRGVCQYGRVRAEPPSLFSSFMVKFRSELWCFNVITGDQIKNDPLLCKLILTHWQSQADPVTSPPPHKKSSSVWFFINSVFPPHAPSSTRLYSVFHWAEVVGDIKNMNPVSVMNCLFSVTEQSFMYWSVSCSLRILQSSSIWCRLCIKPLW